MEKITGSQFGKFDGFGISNLKNILGGECTGGGGHTQGYATRGGVTYAIVSEWDSDSTDSNGATSYSGYTTTWYKLHEL